AQPSSCPLKNFSGKNSGPASLYSLMLMSLLRQTRHTENQTTPRLFQADEREAAEPVISRAHSPWHAGDAFNEPVSN
ncbi:MAG: hypothetical protein Q8M31_22980, partial [Beijerinckiaceae bacterium]|nr:hypothetical protein [Beijerinckiaceae bacterium]